MPITPTRRVRHGTRPHPMITRKYMKIPRLEEISREILDLFNRQLDAISDRNLNDLTGQEKRAYQSRKVRIRHLESELRNLESRP